MAHGSQLLVIDVDFGGIFFDIIEEHGVIAHDEGIVGIKS